MKHMEIISALNSVVNNIEKIDDENAINHLMIVNSPLKHDIYDLLYTYNLNQVQLIANKLAEKLEQLKSDFNGLSDYFNFLEEFDNTLNKHEMINLNKIYNKIGYDKSKSSVTIYTQVMKMEIETLLELGLVK